MKQAITQMDEMGCGAACVAFAANVSYHEAARILGPSKARTDGFQLRELTTALNHFGLNYQHRHIAPRMKATIYQEGTIVFIKKSQRYPYGHYLIRHAGHWMDSWVNLLLDSQIEHAQSGYRKRLPGSAQWVAFATLNRAPRLAISAASEYIPEHKTDSC